MRIFENSGHTPQYDEPELFDRELLTWIEEHEWSARECLPL